MEIISDGFMALTAVAGGNADMYADMTAIMVETMQSLVDVTLQCLVQLIKEPCVMIFCALYLVEIGFEVFLDVLDMNTAKDSDFDGMGKMDDFDEEWNRHVMESLGYDQSYLDK